MPASRSTSSGRFLPNRQDRGTSAAPADSSDFATGAYMSNGGMSFICCNAAYTDKKTGQIKSRITPMLPQGSIVTVPRTQAHLIVTEFGVADLAGKSTWQRAEALINVAHPDLRDGLVKDAEKMNIWRKASK